MTSMSVYTFSKKYKRPLFNYTYSINYLQHQQVTFTVGEGAWVDTRHDIQGLNTLIKWDLFEVESFIKPNKVLNRLKSLELVWRVNPSIENAIDLFIRETCVGKIKPSFFILRAYTNTEYTLNFEFLPDLSSYEVYEEEQDTLRLGSFNYSLNHMYRVSKKPTLHKGINIDKPFAIEFNTQPLEKSRYDNT